MVDKDAVIQIYRTKKSFQTILDYFARRQKNSSRTTAERLQKALASEDIDITRTEIIDLFRALANAGCGVFLVGRKGHPTRFEWSVGLIDVGRVAQGESVEPTPLHESDNSTLVVPDEQSEGLLDHRFVLRPDFDVHLELPEDLSTAEANRLADFIRTLPFT